MELKRSFNKEELNNIFLTSDTHFFHKNILKYCNRPFKDIEEMNQCLIDNWNKKVPKDGLVFHLGDFAFGGFDKIRNIREQLNGKICLIKGNHDPKNNSQNVSTLNEIFDHVTYQMKLKFDEYNVYLNHFPFLCYDGSYMKTIQFFGHCHTSKDKSLDMDKIRLLNLFPNQYDVGVDNNNYSPISAKEAIEIIERQNEHTGEI